MGAISISGIRDITAAWWVGSRSANNQARAMPFKKCALVTRLIFFLASGLVLGAGMCGTHLGLGISYLI